MKITKQKLEAIIKEEFEVTLTERVFPQKPAHREATPEDLAALAALENPDEEGKLSKATLRRVSEDAEFINSMIREQEQLPTWAQEQISLAAKNLQSVKQYLQSLRIYEQKEKVSLIP